jgi:hypothetical protein
MYIINEGIAKVAKVNEVIAMGDDGMECARDSPSADGLVVYSHQIMQNYKLS